MAAHVASQPQTQAPPPAVGGGSGAAARRPAAHSRHIDELGNTRPAPLPTSPLNAVPSAGSDVPEPSTAIARTSPIEPVVHLSSVKYIAQMDFNSYAVKRGVMGSKTTWFLTLDGVLFSVFKNKSAGGAGDNNGNMAPKHTVNVRSHSVTVDVADKEITLVVPGEKKPWKLILQDEDTAQKWARALEAAMHSDIEEHYRLGKTIGGGAFGNVVMAWDKRTGEKLAIKIVQRSPGSSEKSRQHLEHEMDIMRRVDHPGIVRTYAIFNLRRTIYIAMELVAGGDLFDFIATQDSLTESQAIQVIRGILEAVDYLHRQKIVHRDLKPENILCVERKWPVSVKLTDFGFSSRIDDQEDTMRTQVGTAYFMAPEILMNQLYGPAVDCFSCGVILYTMLTGRLPFPGLTTNDYWMHVKNGNAKFPPSLWEDINPLAKNLVKGLLNNDPEKRLTAFAALQHEWIWSTSDRDAEIRRDRSNLHSGRRKLQKARAAFWAITMMNKVRALQESVKIPEIVEAVGEGVKKTGEGIKTGVVKTADGIEKGVKKTGEGVKKTGEAIGEGVKKTADGIEKGVKVTVDGVEKGVKKTGEVIGAGVKKTGEGVKKTAEGIQTGVEKTADGIEKGVKKTVEGVEKGVKKTGEGVKKTGEALGEGVKKTGEGVKKTGEVIGHGGKKTVEGIRTGVVKTADGIEKGVRKTGEGVKKTGEAIGHGVRKTGENVKRGSERLNPRVRRQGSSDERTGDSSSYDTPRSRRRMRRTSGAGSSDSSIASRDRSSSASTRRPPTMPSHLLSEISGPEKTEVGAGELVERVVVEKEGYENLSRENGVNAAVTGSDAGAGSGRAQVPGESALATPPNRLSSEYYSAEEGQSPVKTELVVGSRSSKPDSLPGSADGQGHVSNTTEVLAANGSPPNPSPSGTGHSSQGANSEARRSGSGKKPSLPKLTGFPVGLSGDDESGLGLNNFGMAADRERIPSVEVRRGMGGNMSSISDTGSVKPNLPELHDLPIGLSGDDQESIGSVSTVGAAFGSTFNSIEAQQQAVGAGSGNGSDALRKAALLLMASSAAEEQQK